MSVKLSICCITYNHGKFIRQALEGFVNQKTNFDYEVLIHDDASTDDTQSVIKEFSQKYPDIIKPILQTENQFSKGIDVDRVYNFPRISGEYVAMCEGDDYWTDENKLQKQVDFLDSHHDYNICFHPVKVIWEDNESKTKIYPSPFRRFYKTTLTLSDLLKRTFIQTNSVVYRWQLKGHEDLLPDNVLPGDYFIHLLNAKDGKIGFLPEVMSVYRKHDGGVWKGYGISDEWFLKYAMQNISFYDALEKQFKINRSGEKRFLSEQYISVLLKYKKFEDLLKFAEKFPAEYEKALKISYKEQSYFEKKKLFFKKYIYKMRSGFKKYL